MAEGHTAEEARCFAELMGRQAQWRAELEHELARERLEQRRSNPVARCLVESRPAATKP